MTSNELHSKQINHLQRSAMAALGICLVSMAQDAGHVVDNMQDSCSLEFPAVCQVPATTLIALLLAGIW